MNLRAETKSRKTKKPQFGRLGHVKSTQVNLEELQNGQYHSSSFFVAYNHIALKLSSDWVPLLGGDP